ncbi:alanine racemase [Jonesiaceae bacterium BS-20]|uniref:Alanine racemase n=1 Tax=Jonesiaceae bacterium BS-20 TaxID=3120821 RepID=A0AAU7DWD3_9MICO
MVSTMGPLTTFGSLARSFSAATASLPGPVSVIDLAAFDENARTLVARAAGKPIRLATKSVRVRGLIERAMTNPGFQGLMAYSLAEALWLVSHGFTDVLVAYPTVDRRSLSVLAGDEHARAQITIMIDSQDHLALIRQAVQGTPGAGPIRVALDIDSSLRILERTGFPIHVGVRRSPLHSAAEAAQFVAQCALYPEASVVGLMFYNAQIAGLGDSNIALQLMKKLSSAELAQRRGEVIAAVSAQVAQPLEIINGGGTGSLHLLAETDTVTEVAAGSGLLHPTLFDTYRGLGQRPAAFYGLDIVRNPSARHATAYSGGYVASGPVGPSRVPSPIDRALKLIGSEGMGEVQSPFQISRGRETPQVGDRVWFRHAKAGEQMERFNTTHCILNSQVVQSLPTYRGEGQNFG